MKKRTKWLLAGCVLVVCLALILVGRTLFGFSSSEADALEVIGGADGPTAILVAPIS